MGSGGKTWIAAAALVAALAATAVSPAMATFPGRDGLLSFTWSIGGKYEFPSSGVTGINRNRLSSARLFACPERVALLCYIPDGVAFSPDGRRLAFQVVLYDGLGRRIATELAIVTVDGSSISRVPVGPFVGRPAWSPDGTSLLVAKIVGPEFTDTPTATDLFVIGLDGQVAERLTNGGGSEPDWAADGTIAFTRGGQVQLMRRGEGWRQLTWRGGTAPSWAPEARRLAFVRDGQIWSVRVDGRSPRRLTRRGGISPAWSPDGRRIAFVRPGAELDGLWTMRADGKAPRFTGYDGGPYGYSAIGDPAWQALAAR